MKKICNKNYSALFILTSVFLLTGCVTGKDGHSYIDGHCVTCLNNPITGEAYNYTKKTQGYADAEENSQNQYTGVIKQKNNEAPFFEGNTSLTVRMDIDTAYIRLKREFGFLTRKEWESIYLYDDGGVMHEAIPGVSYRMRFHSPHRFKGVTRDHYVEAVLEKNGRNTDISLKFWVQVSSASLNKYSNSIKQRAERVLR